ncbi:MAG: hypothetical protein ACK4RZ_06515 [Paracoccaceae bacterium]
MTRNTSNTWPLADTTGWQGFFANPPGGRATWNAFFAMLALDLVLTLGHIGGLAAEAMGWISAVPVWLSTFGDDSPAERLNHLKWALVIVFLTLVFLHTRAAVFLALAIVFAIVLADDAWMIHENYGARLRRNPLVVDGFLGIRARQLAEMVVWLALACIILPTIAWGYFRSAPKWRTAALYPLAGFIAAVLAGVGLDTVQEFVPLITSVGIAGALLLTLQLAECLGESAAASLTAAFSFGLLKEYGRKRS